MTDRTVWPDEQISALARRVNGLPEKVGILTSEVAGFREDFREVKDELHDIKRSLEQRDVADTTSRATKWAAGLTAFAATLAALISAITLIITAH